MQDDSRAANIIPPPPLSGADYDAIFATMAATERGRWFLDEYAVRHRGADTELVLAALGRVEAEVRAVASQGGRAHDAGSPQQDGTAPQAGIAPQGGSAPLPDSVRQDLAAASAAVSRARQTVGYTEAEHAAALRGLIDEIDWRLQSLAEALIPDRATAGTGTAPSTANDFDDFTLAIAGPQPKSTAAIELAVADWGFAASEPPPAPEPAMPSPLSARLPPLDLGPPAAAHRALAVAAALPEEPPPPPPRPAFDWDVATKAVAPKPTAHEPSATQPLVQEQVIDERYIETPAAAIARLEAREYARRDDFPQDHPRDDHQREELSQDSLLQEPLLQEPLLQDTLPQDGLVQDDLVQDWHPQDDLLRTAREVEPYSAPEPYSVPEPDHVRASYSTPEPELPPIDDVVGPPERLDLSPIRAALDDLVMAESVAAAMRASEPEPAFRTAFKTEPEPPVAAMSPPRTSPATDLMDLLATAPPARAADVAAEPLFDSELFDAERTDVSPPEFADLHAPEQSLSDLIEPPTAELRIRRATPAEDDGLGDLTKRVVDRPADEGEPTPPSAAAQLQAPRFTASPSPSPATIAAPRAPEPAADGDKAQVLDRLEHMRRSIASLMDEIAQKTGRPIERPRP